MTVFVVTLETNTYCLVEVSGFVPIRVQNTPDSESLGKKFLLPFKMVCLIFNVVDMC